MAVYMIQAGESGPVKIGKANKPLHRMTHLQTGHYETLRLIRVVSGGLPEETWLRVHFQHLHMRGEWHRYCPTMLAVMPCVMEPPRVQPFVGLRECPLGVAGVELLRMHRGALARACLALGITKSAASQWKAVPAEHLVAIEQATGLPRERLRPDLYRTGAAA